MINAFDFQHHAEEQDKSNKKYLRELWHFFLKQKYHVTTCENLKMYAPEIVTLTRVGCSHGFLSPDPNLPRLVLFQ